MTSEQTFQNSAFDYNARYICRTCGQPFEVLYRGITAETRDCLAAHPLPFCDKCAEDRIGSEKKEAMRRRIANALDEAEIPAYFRQTYDRGKGNEDLLNFVLDNLDRTLYVSGPAGIGKTFAVCEAAKRNILSRRFLFLNWEEAAKDYLSACSVSESSGNAYRRNLIGNTGTLILDDFGKGSFSQRAVDLVYYLANYIYEHPEKRLWITANLPAEKYLDGITDGKARTDLHAALSRLSRVRGFAAWGGREK